MDRLSANPCTKNTLTKPSKLSLGPKNPHHRTYRSNETSINQALCAQISKRRIDIKSKELYETAGITRPTFYLHCHNPQNALVNYEQKLSHEFQTRIATISNKKTFYIILTQFIRRNRNYFTAVATGSDHHLLKQVLSSYRETLVGYNTSDHNFAAYVGVSIFLINYWMVQSDTSVASADLYAERLASIRPIRWW